jgi:hypothetical protein
MKRLQLLTVLVLVAAMGHAQTPDGDAPANEGVCDELIGFTPGLYGLCVAFCEAQDCEATFDPATGNVAFDPGCRPSNPRLLAKYNKLKNPADPAMPCVKNGCPCWTENEIALIADGETTICGAVPDHPGDTALFGWDLEANLHEFLDACGPPTCYLEPTGICVYVARNPFTFRWQLTTPEQFDACIASIETECLDRGF